MLIIELVYKMRKSPTFTIPKSRSFYLDQKLSYATLNANDTKVTFFPGPLAFCKKAVERVNSEKNILNSSVECVEWSGVEWSGVEWSFLEKVICMYIIRSASMS